MSNIREWKDTTSYRRGEPRLPKHWTTYSDLGTRLTLTRYHQDFPEHWLVMMPTFRFERTLPDIDLDDIAGAQVRALEVAQKYFQSIANSVVEPVSHPPVPPKPFPKRKGERYDTRMEGHHQLQSRRI
jgi:hypothetical protein